MSKQDVRDGGPTFERLGQACNRISDAGFPQVAAALAGRVRERRGKVRAGDYPVALARELLALAEEAELLVRNLMAGAYMSELYAKRHREEVEQLLAEIESG